MRSYPVLERWSAFEKKVGENPLELEKSGTFGEKMRLRTHHVRAAPLRGVQMFYSYLTVFWGIHTNLDSCPEFI